MAGRMRGTGLTEGFTPISPEGEGQPGSMIQTRTRFLDVDC